MEERWYWLAFALFSGVGPVKFAALLNTFQTAKDAWEAPENDLKQILGEKLVLEFEKFRLKFSFEDYVRILLKKGVFFTTLEEDSYPKLLKQTKKPPFVLFVRGDINILSSRAIRRSAESVAISEITSSHAPRNDSLEQPRIIAIVGTRKITSYGREVTEMFTRDLVNSGFTVISGLAMGVDALAHKTTIDNNGKTIAVLGCGVDCCSPGENTYLYDEILESGGCIVSELPIGHPPSVGSFPARNRIIAGMSQAVLVTEGAVDSGALITADFAFQNARKVFAVPGSITSSLSKGPHKLLSKGAKMVTSGEDIVRELGVTNYEFGKNKKRIIGETKEEQKILDLLQNEPMHFDQIVRLCKLDSSKVGTTLSIMEIKGLIKNTQLGFQINISY